MRVAVLPVSLLIAILLPGTSAPVSAQVRQPSSAVNALEARLSADAPAPVIRSFPGRLLSALGGAAIGAGMGFFASQVVRGDWDDDRGAGIDRSAWAAIGGSIGLAMGFSFPIGPGRPARPETAAAPSRRILRADEWENTGVNNAWDAVRSYRPEWLNGRGVHIIGESADETIVVMLDQVRLGGVSTLREIAIQMVRTIEFVEPGAATTRWGAGFSHGVILVTAEGGIAKQDSQDR